MHMHRFHGTAFRTGGRLPQFVTSVSKEHVCKDEWSAYCWDKSWGSCPVTCTYEETYCYSYVYDSTGLLCVCACACVCEPSKWMQNFQTSVAFF